MIIQAGLADRDDARALGELAQRCDYIFAGFLGIRRMNADDSEDIRIFVGKIDRAPAALDGGPNRNNARDASLGCASQHIIKIVRKIGVIEMRVSFYEHCRLKISNFKLRETERAVFKSAIFNLKSAIPYHSM